jgi:uncharacterized protein with HEPN domain
MKREYSLFVKDILEAMEKIEEFVGSMDFDEFVGDDKTASAVVRKLEIIGEASKNIPKPIQQKYEKLPWKEMARMRDKISHAYFGVDYEIVWKVIKEKLPEIKPSIRKILKETQEKGKRRI